VAVWVLAFQYGRGGFGLVLGRNRCRGAARWRRLHRSGAAQGSARPSHCGQWLEQI